MHAANQPQQCRLSTARAAKHGCHFAALKFQAQIVQDGSTGVVSERDVVNVYECVVHLGEGNPEGLSHGLLEGHVARQ
jgi:hypothetical protein